jgi:hypothetical protein
VPVCKVKCVGTQDRVAHLQGCDVRRDAGVGWLCQLLVHHTTTRPIDCCRR